MSSYRYHALIGTGGIGSGVFFALNGDHTLGREESRSGHFLDRRDYCKLHIISHYVKALLGPAFPVILLGKVGADEAGARLRAEMAEAGLDLRYVEASQGLQTLQAICFVYPDGSGGNLTTDDSACAHVGPDLVARAADEFARFAGRGVALAAAEVPLAARLRVLELGTAHDFLRVASFTSAEMAEVVAGNVLDRVDLLAANLDEAAALVGLSSEARPAEDIVQAATAAAGLQHPTLKLSITAGARGSWSWDGEALVHVPAFSTHVVSTAGAGDAHLAGIIAGLATGVPLGQAQELGALVAAQAVTSPHTIAKEINRTSLAAFAAASGARLSQPIREYLGP